MRNFDFQKYVNREDLFNFPNNCSFYPLSTMDLCDNNLLKKVILAGQTFEE